MRRVSVLAIAVAVAIAACSSQSEVLSTPPSEPPPSAESTTMLATAEVADSPNSFAEDLEATLGIAAIATTSLESGGGTRPLLEWEPVEGASFYTLVVVTPEDEAYWGWTGPETTIHVGGEPQLEESAAGPSIVPGMTWSVAAYDDEFHVIAVSPRAPISP